MSSSEVYAIANQCRQMGAEIMSAIPELEGAKSAVNTDQIGKVPDAITAKLDTLITNLSSAAESMYMAAVIADREAGRLAELERIEREKEIARAKARAKKKEAEKAANSAKNRTAMEY